MNSDICIMENGVDFADNVRTTIHLLLLLLLFLLPSFYAVPSRILTAAAL